jgi:DNA-3-methyladenine glycosylase
VYDGHDDLASHASKGKTKRTEIMFGPPGYWYVYLCYGVHWMLNLVTREQDYPAAILIRGGIGENGEKINGPGKITKYLKIDKKLDTTKAGEESGLWIEWRRKQISGKIKKSPRIGVDYAGPIWSKKYWRYVLI